MKAGSMEGLIGASVNMELSRTPMRVYKEAERRGDTEAMKRAMGYVTDFQGKAQEELPKELKVERREQEIRRRLLSAEKRQKNMQKKYRRTISRTFRKQTA